MLNKKMLKRYFIIAVITSLVVSAGMGIFALLFGSFSADSWKIIGSTMAVGLFSITSLANLRTIESEHFGYRLCAWFGIGFSVFGMLFVLLLIWSNFETEFWRMALILIILSIATAHVSLILPVRSRVSSLLKITVALTLICIATVANFLIYLTFSGSFGSNNLIYRLIGVFAILDVLGSILVPIFARLGTKDTPTQTPDILSPPTDHSNSQS